MEKMKRIFLYMLLLALAIAFAGQNNTPTAAAAPAQQQNLLKNPGFEAPYTNDGAAQDWVRWHRESSPDKFGDCTNGYHKKPRWGNATDFVHGGSTSQFVGNNWDTWAGGMWQTVSVTPGATYRFSFWARGFGAMKNSDPSYGALQMNLKAGADPNGSGLWNDGDVVWGAAGNAHDQWVQFSVQVTATGDKITVFTAADWAVPGVNQCYQFLNIYQDDAELVQVSVPTPTSPPLPTQPPPPPATATPIPPTPTETPIPVTPTETAIPTETASPTPSGGIVCVNAFVDDNANGLHDANEGFMAGVTLTIADATQVVHQTVSAGSDSPTCFTGVAPGAYQIAQVVPGRLEMTTAANTALVVEEGKTYGVEFGSRVRPDDEPAPVATSAVASNNTPTSQETAVSPTTPQTESSTGAMAYVGIGVLVLAVLMLGVLIFMLLRR